MQNANFRTYVEKALGQSQKGTSSWGSCKRVRAVETGNTPVETGNTPFFTYIAHVEKQPGCFR